MSDFVLPGHYKLLTAELRTLAGKRIDVTHLIPVFSIEESLGKDSIRGYANFLDKTGLLENLPIRAEETLVLVIEDALKQRLTYEMAIYKITDVTPATTNDGVEYTLHFFSKSSFEAAFRRIIEPFNDRISVIAKQIFEKYYPKSSKPLIVEDTVGLFRCVVPNYTPMQTMNFLANRAFSTQSPSCSFRFFETSDNYYFVSDEYLIKRFIDNKTDIKEFSFSEALDKSGGDFVTQMQNLSEIRNGDRVNTVMDLTSGSYRSNVIEIDLIKRQATLPGKSNKYEYDYREAKKRYMSVAGRGRDDDVHSPEFVERYFTPENERRYIVIRDYDDSGTLQLRGDQFFPQITTNRIAYLQHLNNTTVYTKAPGRLDLNVGDLINVRIPQFNSSNTRELNPQLSGYYMIYDLIHTFKRDVHETVMKIVKYDWSTRE